MNSELRIGLVCWPSFGGSGVVASELAVGLAGRGHQVFLLASAPPSRTLPPCPRLVFVQIDAPEYPLFESAPYTLAAASAIAEVAQKERLDLVHVHYALPHAASAFLARAMLGAAAPRFVTSLHGTDVTGVGALSAYRPVLRHTILASDAIVAPSQYLRAAAHAGLELPAEAAIQVIPNFVDTDRFVPKARPRGPGPVLMHVSNLRPVKRVVDLVEVLARVREHTPASLVVIGDGPDRGLAEARAQELGVSAFVSFLGKRIELVAEMQKADLFLLPSASESFGVAALEAMSTGVPVLGYAVGGLPEVVTEDVGRLVAPYDVAALARSVVELWSAPEQLTAMGLAARSRALSLYRVGPALDAYEACYRRVLSAPRREVLL